VTQQTRYPWDGNIAIRVDPDRPIDATLAVRIPGWARGEAMPSDLYRFAQVGERDPKRIALHLNGKPLALTTDNGYARIRRRWQKGDIVQVDLPMPIRRVLAHDGIADDRDKAAIQRGPIVYCVEGADNNGRVADLRLPLDAELRHTFDPALLGGVEVISGDAVVAVPYYAWANRGKGEMTVWIPYR
jgi:DUF1680 family protein